MDKINSFSTRIKELRQQHGYTQQYMADFLGIKYQSYQAYETGVAHPNIDKLIDLANLFKVTIDDLVGREYPKKG